MAVHIERKIGGNNSFTCPRWPWVVCSGPSRGKLLKLAMADGRQVDQCVRARVWRFGRKEGVEDEGWRPPAPDQTFKCQALR